MEYLSFATRAANRHERSQQWRSVTRHPHAELGDDREASIRGCDLGELRLCSVTLGEHRFENDRADCELDENEQVKFVFQEEGECVLEQAGRSVTLGAGQWCMIDKTRPFFTAASRPTRQLALSLPRRRLNAGHHPMLSPQGFLHGAGSVLHGSVATAVHAATVLGRRDRVRLGDALVHMLNMAWQSDPDVTSARTRRTQRYAVIDYVEKHLADPELDVERIAHDLGCSKRTLHNLFADSSTTLSRLIWNRRLEHCRQKLLDPAQARRSITEIAYSCGFNDSQHFSRAFKARFGSSPRDFRNTYLLHRSATAAVG